MLNKTIIYLGQRLVRIIAIYASKDYDQVAVKCATLPFDDLQFEPKTFSSTAGAIDYDVFLKDKYKEFRKT